MAAKSKKRKLPADLHEAEALLRTTSSARRAVLEAYNSLQVVELNEVEGVPQPQALSPDALTHFASCKVWNSGVAENGKNSSKST